jgi:hypothetical protein
MRRISRRWRRNLTTRRMIRKKRRRIIKMRNSGRKVRRKNKKDESIWRRWIILRGREIRKS